MVFPHQPAQSAELKARKKCGPGHSLDSFCIDRGSADGDGRASEQHRAAPRGGPSCHRHCRPAPLPFPVRLTRGRGISDGSA